MPALLAVALLQAAAAGPVTVRISGVRDATGLVRVEVCSAHTWLHAGCEYTVNAPARAGQMVVTVPDVASGAWAVQAYHDRNGDKEVDRGPLGLPAEEIGFSNEPPIGLRGPAFARAAFQHSEASDVRVRLKKYWGR